MIERTVVLDAGPIGLITNPKLSSQGVACNRWLQSHLKSGNRIIIPEIADYEVRRELLRANKKKGLARLVIAYVNCLSIYQLQLLQCGKPLNCGHRRGSRDSQPQGTKQLMVT